MQSGQQGVQKGVKHTALQCWGSLWRRRWCPSEQPGVCQSGRSLNLLMSLEGVWNGELWSMNIILTYVFFWSRWKRAVWRARKMVSSVCLAVFTLVLTYQHHLQLHLLALNCCCSVLSLSAGTEYMQIMVSNSMKTPAGHLRCATLVFLPFGDR